MKIYPAIMFIFLSSLVHAECDKKIDASKVVLFIDTNNSEPEIQAAEKAACDRGEKFVVVPKNYLEYAEPIADLNNGNYEKYQAFKSIQPSTLEATQEALDEIKKQNGTLQTLIISGHNGGGQFSGLKGSITRSELSWMAEDNPSIINQVKSLMLLGCYTGVQKEIYAWKLIFPEVKLIAGYDLKAPLSDAPEGHDYITEILGKEKELIAQADAKELTDFAKLNIGSMFGMYTAVYVSCGPENKDLYYASNDQTRRFGPMVADCTTKTKEIQDVQKQIMAYQTGELEPPLNTNGAIRDLYNKARGFEHCSDQFSYGFSVNNVFNLLFYDGVKKNFARFHENDLAETEQIMATITAAGMEQELNKVIAQMEAELNKYKSDLQLLQTSLKDYNELKDKEMLEADGQMHKLMDTHPFLEKIIYDGEKINLSDDQKAILDKCNELIKISNAILNFSLKNPEQRAYTLENNIEYHEGRLERLQQNLASLKQDPDKVKKIWSPTAKNLEAHTRKELLDNQHKIDELLSIPGLLKDQKRALTWAGKVTFHHLETFQNPFTWHEVTPGEVEAPERVMRLKDIDP